MRIFVLLLILTSFVFHSRAQTKVAPENLTDDQWNILFTELANENWKRAFDLSSEYLTLLRNDDAAGSIANLRYMLIYSAAGAVSVGKLSYDDLEKQIPKVVGKKIATPFHPLGVDCRPPMFNYICKTNEGEFDAMATVTNSQATSILAFEYIKLANKFDIAKNQGKSAAVIGIANKIVPNPNKSTIVIVRIYIKDADIILQSDTQSKIK